MDDLPEEEFARIVGVAWDHVPAEYRERIQNVALLIEDEPSEEVRAVEGLEGDDTLLGLYQGIPLTARGEGYGTGATMPDTITVYRAPTLHEAEDLIAEGYPGTFPEAVAQVVRDTLWHELGHYFGWDEHAIHARENEGTNNYNVA